MTTNKDVKRHNEIHNGFHMIMGDDYSPESIRQMFELFDPAMSATWRLLEEWCWWRDAEQFEAAERDGDTEAYDCRFITLFWQLAEEYGMDILPDHFEELAEGDLAPVTPATEAYVARMREQHQRFARHYKAREIIAAAA